LKSQVHVNSPWVLPVYVLSNQRDATRHLIPKEAKCTIDTGNLQGNIVSRAFAIDVLGYSEADFKSLTKLEEDGGAGVTGHRLIPEGAIYLTWYYNNSTRVFRDMRFLVSKHPMYDLIIGARSIQKNNILDVPNLMAGQEPPENGIVVPVKPPTSLPTPSLNIYFSTRANTSAGEDLEALRTVKIEANREMKTKQAAVVEESLKPGGPDSQRMKELTEVYNKSMEAVREAEKSLREGERIFKLEQIKQAHEAGKTKEADALRKAYAKQYPEEPAPPSLPTHRHTTFLRGKEHRD
jgi:hypothetical protein